MHENTSPPPQIHALRTIPKFFAAVRNRSKPFEVRENDRDYRVGDILALMEWEPGAGAYTGATLVRQVSCILDSSDLPRLPAGLVVMGIYFEALTEFAYGTEIKAAIKQRKAEDATKECARQQIAAEIAELQIHELARVRSEQYTPPPAPQFHTSILPHWLSQWNFGPCLPGYDHAWNKAESNVYRCRICELNIQNPYVSTRPTFNAGNHNQDNDELAPHTASAKVGPGTAWPCVDSFSGISFLKHLYPSKPGNSIEPHGPHCVRCGHLMEPREG